MKKCALGKGEKYEKLREKYAEKNFAKLDDKRNDSCEVEGKSLLLLNKFFLSVL